MNLACYVAGKPIESTRQLAVNNPFTGQPAGTLRLAARHDVERAIHATLLPREPLTRYERSQILDKARQLLPARFEELSGLVENLRALIPGQRLARQQCGMDRALHIVACGQS